MCFVWSGGLWFVTGTQRLATTLGGLCGGDGARSQARGSGMPAGTKAAAWSRRWERGSLCQSAAGLAG